MTAADGAMYGKENGHRLRARRTGQTLRPTAFSPGARIVSHCSSGAEQQRGHPLKASRIGPPMGYVCTRRSLLNLRDLPPPPTVPCSPLPRASSRSTTPRREYNTAEPSPRQSSEKGRVGTVPALPAARPPSPSPVAALWERDEFVTRMVSPRER